MLVYYYPTCGTVKKALKWLDNKNISYEKKHIVNETMTKEELASIIEMSKLPIGRFFNTSGKAYRELNFKEKRKVLSEDEIITQLVENPMLLKRPIVVGDDFALVGFKELEYENIFG